MLTLAWRNLVHDKVRLAVTVTGIVFAVVLIVVELGLFLGFTTTTSSLIDRSNADLWITAPRVPYIEQGVPFSERKLTTMRPRDFRGLVYRQVWGLDHGATIVRSARRR
jgi:hypothetical protein